MCCFWCETTSGSSAGRRPAAGGAEICGSGKAGGLLGHGNGELPDLSLVGGEDGTDGLPLFGRELGAEGGRVDDLFPLIGGHLAEVGDGANHEAAPGNGVGVQLLDGAVPLLLLLRAETLETLNSIEHASPLGGVHAVEAVQLVELALLKLRRKLAEAGLLLQSAMLIGRGEILVVLHPLFEVYFALGCADGCVGSWSNYGRRRLLRPGLRSGFGTLRRASLLRVFLTESAGEGRADCDQQKDCRGETNPGWKMRFHDLHGLLKSRLAYCLLLNLTGPNAAFEV